MRVHTKNSLILFSFSLSGAVKALFSGRASVPPLCRGLGGVEGGSQRSLERCGTVRKTLSSGMAALRRHSQCIAVKLQAVRETNEPLGSRFHLPFVCKSSWLFPWLSLWAGCSGESDSASAAGLPAVFECEDRWLWLWCPSTACTAALHTPAAGTAAVPNRSHTHSCMFVSYHVWDSNDFCCTSLKRISCKYLYICLFAE